MRCPKCGLHSAIPTSVLTSLPPIPVYVCCAEGCNHEWRGKTRGLEIDPNHLSLEERVELLERLVFSKYSDKPVDHLPIPNPYLEDLMKKKFSWECIDKAKEGNEDTGG